MRSSAGSECIKSLIKLKREEETIEKALDNCLDHVKAEPEVLRILKNEQCSRASERKKLTNSLRSAIVDITKCLSEIKTSIKDMQEGRKIDIDSFKEQLISLAAKIREFKKDSATESLAREEIELDQDARSIFLAVTNQDNQSSRGRKKSTESDVTISHDFTRAKDFDALVAKTGHTQNWSEPDHLFFLKVRKSSKNVATMVSAIRKKCPDLTAERIVDHEAWYKIYLDMREKRRATIREWRENRDARKRERMRSNAEPEKLSEESERATSDESVENNSGTIVPSTRIAANFGKTNEKVAGNGDRREMIKRWREERERALSLECERTRSGIESLRARKENRRLARARAVKSAVIARGETKMDDATSSGSTTSNDVKKLAPSPSKSKGLQMIGCFRRQDEEFLKRRKAALEGKRSGQSNVSLSGNKVHSRSNVETSTLLNPTKVWLERCKAARDPDTHVSSRNILYVKDIPKLGTYNWKNQRSE